MKSEQKLWLAVVAVAIIAVTALFLPLSGGLSFGASGTRMPNGISADTTSPVAGELRGADLTLTDDAVITDDVTINGGSVVVTTTQLATSTVNYGCWQRIATSTETPIRSRLVASTTPNLLNGGTGQFLLVFQYGTCPD